MAHSLLRALLTQFGSRVAAMTGGCVLTIVLVSSSGCLLFTDPINMPPTVDSIVALAPVWHGQGADFQATVSDPNGDAVTLEWSHVAGPCSPIAQPAERVQVQTLHVDGPDTQRTFCVWVFATDSHGAMVPGYLQIVPLDHPPVAVISVVRPNPAPPAFPLYSTLEFSGAGSTDADPTDVPRLMYQWSLVGRPPGSLASVVTCPFATDPQFTCLTPDKRGDYQVQLAVDDVFDQISSTTKSSTIKTLTVADDAPPCLGETMPTLLASTVERDPNDPTDAVFAVMTVVDDGDPFPDPFPIDPMAGAHFSWFLGHGTDPVVYLGRDFPSYTVTSGTFVSGDVARVRVEIRDRSNKAAIDLALLGCGDEPVCAVSPGSGCFQRMTWKIEYR